MTPREVISFLNVIEKLKCNTRHSWTSSGRRESVAEHSWRLAVMAMLAAEEYPGIDEGKLVAMCLLHDLGEAVVGDTPAFYKTDADEEAEKEAIAGLLASLPPAIASSWGALFSEMEAGETTEAKLFLALDHMEVLVSHNEADLSTWLPLEYEANLTYGQKSVDFSPWTQALKEEIKRDALKKMGNR